MNQRIAPLVATIASYRESNPAPYKESSDYMHRLIDLAADLSMIQRGRSEESFFDLTPPDPTHYVYLYLDPRKPGRYKFICPSGKVVSLKYEPFYVGKGQKHRMDAHLKQARKSTKTAKLAKIRSIWNAGLEPIILVTGRRVGNNLAQALEVDLIAGIGRKIVGGPLTNLTDGGDGNAGWVTSAETRKRISDAKRGTVVSDETRALLSAMRKGVKKSAEHNKKNSDANKGRAKTGRLAKGHKKSAEECRKNSEAQQRIKAYRAALPDLVCDVCGDSGKVMLNHFTNCRGPAFKGTRDPRMAPSHRAALPSVPCPHCKVLCRGPSFLEHFGNCAHR